MNEISLEHRLASLVASFPCAQMAVLPALQIVGQEGELTGAALAAVAQACQVGEDSLRLLLEAYPALQGGKRGAVVCEGLSCFLNGARYILAKPEDYGLEAGGFERASCLGYCFAAPVLREPSGAVRHIEIHREMPGSEP